MAWRLIANPDACVARLSLLLVARYEALAACVATEFPVIELCSALVNHSSIAPAALDFLTSVPRLTGSRTALDGPLFSALRGIIAGPDRMARAAALRLLVRLRNEGFCSRVIATCQHA